MPRRSRKKIVGKVEDVERADSEKQLAKLEHELHQEWESQGETETAADEQDT